MINQRATKLKSEKVQGARRETEAGDQTRLKRMGYEFLGGGAQRGQEAKFGHGCKNPRYISINCV